MDRMAIEEIRARRQRLRWQLEGALGGIDDGPTIEVVEEELVAIEMALASF